MTRQILITGGQGQVAQSLLECEENFPDFQLMGFSSKELDITDEQNVRAKLLSGSIEAVINCAAYTDVDGAESDSARAFEVNEKGAGQVATGGQAGGPDGIIVPDVAARCCVRGYMLRKAIGISQSSSAIAQAAACLERADRSRLCRRR